MAYKQNGITIVDDEGNWADRSFDSVSDISATEVKITASDTAASDRFGAVSVGCGRIVVGSIFDDDAGSSSGSAYIYDLDGTNEIKITASDDAGGDSFGCATAVGEGKIAIGAYNESGGGSLYIYDLNGTNEIKVRPSDAASSDQFARYKIDIGCGKIVVGAHGNDDDGSSSGSAYIYDLDGTNEIKLTASDAAASAFFGWSVTVGYGRIAVGAWNAGGNGAVYLYTLDGFEYKKLSNPDGTTGGRFGRSVDIGCGRIVVGADNGTGGVDGSGSVYVYDLNGNYLDKISASDGASGDQFGYGVAVGNGKIVVGAYTDDDDGSASGSAYIYDLDGTNEIKLTASDAAGGDEYGEFVAVGSGKVVVGAKPNEAAYVYDLPENTDTYWENIIEGFRW